MTVDRFTNVGWNSVEQYGAPLFYLYPPLLYLRDDVELKRTFFDAIAPLVPTPGE